MDLNNLPPPYDPSIEKKSLASIRGIGPNTAAKLKLCNFENVGALVDVFVDWLNNNNGEFALENYRKMATAYNWLLSERNLLLSFDEIQKLAAAKALSQTYYDESIEERPIDKVPGIGQHSAELLLEKYGIFQIGHLIHIFHQMMKTEGKTNWDIRRDYVNHMEKLLNNNIQTKWIWRSFNYLIDKAEKKNKLHHLRELWNTQEKIEAASEDKENAEPPAKKKKVSIDPATDREKYLATLACPVCLDHQPDNLWVYRWKHHMCKDCYKGLVFAQWELQINTPKKFQCETCKEKVTEAPLEFIAPF